MKFAESTDSRRDTRDAALSRGRRGWPVWGLILSALFLFAWQPAAADNGHSTWQILTKNLTAKPGETITVRVKCSLISGAWVYGTRAYPDSLLFAPQPTAVTAGDGPSVTMAGSVRASKPPKTEIDVNFDSLRVDKWKGEVTFSVPIRIAKSASPGKLTGWVEFYYQTCVEGTCLPPKEDRFEFAVEVEEDVAEVDTAYAVSDTAIAGADSTDADTAHIAGIPADSLEVAVARQDTASAAAGSEFEKAKSEGLWALLFAAIGAGFVALSTPCVFPMIPITVSFFTKKEQESRVHAVKDALVYAVGIILTFSLIGVGTAAAFEAAGVQQIATNPWINLLIAGIFVAFALSLFGLFEIQVPSSVLNKLNMQANKSTGIASILLMSLVFTLTSFTCSLPMTAPILVAAQNGEIWWAALGMTAFAIAFASPFVLLALFPSWLKAMPKSGGWLNAVKVTMGFVELAAAMKFLSNVDLVWNWGFLTRELVLAVWISIAILTSLYLLGRFRLPHDSPTEKIGAVRMLFSMAFLTIGFWFLTGLFGGRLGEIDAFLPPQEYPGKGNTSIMAGMIGGEGVESASEEETANRDGKVFADGLYWIQDDYHAALNESKSSGKPLFVDFTGYTCTNCRWMERNVFTREDVQSLMNKYVLARLYTDRRNESNLRNREIQKERFQTVELPLYAVFDSNDRVVDKTLFTRDVDEFKDFLRRGLELAESRGIEDERSPESVPDELASR